MGVLLTSSIPFLRSPPSASLCPGSGPPPTFSTSRSHRGVVSPPAPHSRPTPVLRFPGLDDVLRHPDLPGHLFGFAPRLQLLQRPDHLRLGVIAL